jgi:Yip1 domain
MATTTVPAEAPERVNPVGRILGALFSPKATFESIVRRPTWILPTILYCVLFILVVGIFGHRGGWPYYLEKQVANNSRFQQMSTEQQQQVMNAQLKYAPPVAEAEGVIVPVLLVVILAAVFLGVFNGLGGVKFGYRTSMGITAHAWLPNLISGILGVVVVSVKDPSQIDLQNIVASNVGAYLSSDSPKWIVSMASSLDIFAIWSLVLLALGYSTISPKKMPFGKALAYVFCMWVVWVFVKVGLVAAFT